MTTLRTIVHTALAALAASPAFAQGDAPAAPPSQENYRWSIYTSCTVAFVAIAVYLVITHRRAAEASEELDAVERRLDDLERGSK